ncbi:hypothetical protein [Streptomyces sp. NRRL B-24484]|uniref:hypothetical protein n=1 Tax=Streptomyces sp. NRRL B-24484 TaxID=1463833 RepID=UPI0004BF5902|nr:hypothetical protein [Streptomyces sp. NRRL B-24484]
MPATALPIHPYTGLQAIGLRRDGRPIWPVRGGSGEGSDPTTPPAPTPATGDPTTPAMPAPAAPPAEPGPTAEQLAEAQRQATEAAEQRDQLQAALDAINKAINPDATGAESDPAQLAAAVADRDRQLAGLGEQLRAARVELAAHKAAETAGARPDRLLNSRAFVAALSALDPSDAQFDTALQAAITAAVESDPELYRATTAPARSGGEFRGAPTTRPQPASLLEAISARLNK